MNSIRILLIAIIMISSVFDEIVLAWNDDITHRDISEYAAELSVLGKGNGDYLINLGLANGIDENLTWEKTTKIVRAWLRDGAFYEDYGTRSLNHFHNPLKPWLDAGLSDIMLGQSALLWAQSYNESQQPMTDDWSWQRTRKLYYLALTSNDAVVRSMFFAETFRGLGQQMHLLQDMAVPYHVRNDAHPLDAIIGKNGRGSYFETWTKNNIRNLNYMKAFAPNPIMPNLIFSSTPTPSGLAPITLLFDTDQYDGTNPSTSNDRGLSEYTNANFFSDDTINMPNVWVSDGHAFPYPNAGNTNLQAYIDNKALATTVIAEDGVADFGFWIKKTGDEPIEHFVKPGYTTNNLYDTLGGGYVYYTTFVLDDACHHEYAEKLLPRAVGYSTGLLNYFFRGSIGISGPSSGYYAMAKAPAGGFTNVKLRAINTTPNGEAMQDGSISLVVKYQSTEDTDFVYQIASESTGIRSIPADQPVELTFNLPSEVPVTATDVYLQVVYHGQLGNEDGAVAVGFKDISEPTPIDIYNNMDKICLYSAWYDAGSQEAISAAANATDIYPHVMQELYIKVSPLSNPKWATPEDHDIEVKNFLPGTLQRTGYILTDIDPSNSDFVYTIYTVPGTLDASDHWIHEGVATAIEGIAWQNQVEYDPIRCGSEVPCRLTLVPGFYTFRGTEMWWGAGLIYSNVAYPSKSCSLDEL